MAKQAVGPVVRHLEKGVLLLAAGAFLYFVAMFGVVSPNTVDLNGPIGPADIDRKVKEKAEAVRNKLINAKPIEEPITDPMATLQSLANPLAFAGLAPLMPRPVPFNPTVPTFGERNVSRIELAKALRLPAPQVTQGRSGVHLVPPQEFGSGSPSMQDESNLFDINWVTISSVFEHANQEKICRDAGYALKFSSVLFAGVDVQRRELLADGSYSDWQDVRTVSTNLPPTFPSVEVYTDEQDKANVSEDQRSMVDDFRGVLEKGDNQRTILRPIFPEPKYGDPWNVANPSDHKISEMNLTLGASEEAGEPKAPDRPAAKLLDLAEDALDAGKLKDAKMLVEQAELAIKALDQDSPTTKRLKREFEKLSPKIDEEIDAAGGEDALPKPDANVPVQLVWAHDAESFSVRSGRTYQYRMRARIYNQSQAKPTVLNKPEDAEVAYLVGEWSEPSVPVGIAPDTVFFVKSSKPGKDDPAEGKCSVEVFKWYHGEWIKARFDARVGDVVGGRKRVEAPDMEGRPVRERINFDTGARVVAIEFDRPWYERRGSRFTNPDGNTTSLIWVDETGQLHENLESVDTKLDKHYSYLNGIVYKPPRR